MKKTRRIFCGALLLALCLASVCRASAAKTVAQIGKTAYSSLQGAVNHVKKGETIKVTANITSDKAVSVNRPGVTFTIDFGSHTFNYKGKKSAVKISAGNLTVKKAKIVSSNNVFKVYQGAKLTVSDGKYQGFHINWGTMRIKSGTFTDLKKSDDCELISNSGTLTIEKGTFTDRSSNAIWNKGGKVIIKNGTFKTLRASGSVDKTYPCIYNQVGTLTIENATVTAADTALYNRGTLKVKGGKFTADRAGALQNWTKAANATVTGGTFVSKKSNAAYNGTDAVLKVSGGTFKSEKAYYALWNKGKATLTAGTFSSASSSDIGSEKGAVTTAGSKVKGTIEKK